MLATALVAIAAAYLAATVGALARLKDGYSHIKNTISELGEIGAPHQRFVAVGVFLPVGLVVLAVAYLVRASMPAAAALALCIATGYITAAVFPCDPGSPLSGSFRQSIHNLAGGAEYIGGGFALIVLSESLGDPFKIAGFVVLISALALSVTSSNSIRGAVQRVAECCLFGGLAMAVWQRTATVWFP